jgi:hypothetical protein
MGEPCHAALGSRTTRSDRWTRSRRRRLSLSATRHPAKTCRLEPGRRVSRSRSLRSEVLEAAASMAGPLEGEDAETIVLTVVHLHWAAVDEGQWSLVRAMLSTRQLAPLGCMSWHSRRSGGALRITALWDDKYGAVLFSQGRLQEVVQLAELEDPEMSLVPLRGTYATGQRPAEKTEAIGRPAAYPALTERTAA